MVCRKINEGISEYLRAQPGIDNVTALVGTLRTTRETQDSAVSG